MLPRTKGVRMQPTPQGSSAADLSHEALGHHLPLDIGEGAREGESQTMRKLTGEGFYLN